MREMRALGGVMVQALISASELMCEYGLFAWQALMYEVSAHGAYFGDSCVHGTCTASLL
jgi:hypothetical protein